MSPRSTGPEPTEREPADGEPSQGKPTEAQVGPGAPRETARERKARLAAIFGDVLPETTRDERGEGGSGGGGESAGDRWLRDQVPPHHGGGRAGL